MARRNIFNPVNNNRGSSLSITLIVIAVLAFSLTAITQFTINLSSATSVQIAQVTDESTAKALITQAINEFEAYIVATDDFPLYNSSEIPRVFADYDVIVTDETDNLPDFGNGTYAYKFAVDLDNGSRLFKYAYMSNSGSALNTYYPFEYSLGTEGDLVLNSGLYDDIAMFGEDIHLSGVSPFYDSFNDVDIISPYASMSYPTLTDSLGSDIFVGNSYTYCASLCYTVNSPASNPVTMNKDNYNDVVGSGLIDQGNVQSDEITSFFGTFNYEDYMIEQVGTVFPEASRTITDTFDFTNFDTVLRNNSDTITYAANGRTVLSYPTTAYYDITNDPNWSFDANRNRNLSFSALYDGDLTINRNVRFSSYTTEGMIILGDLTLDNSRSQDLQLRGNFVVTGDLTIIGNTVDFYRSTFVVFGETYIDFDDGYGIRTDANNYEFALIAKDNIVIDNMWTNYTTNQPPLMSALIYTEESVYIDAVDSKVRMEGSIFARALGVSGNTIDLVDENTNQVNGIFINSYRGYVYWQWSWDWDTWTWSYDPIFVPNGTDNGNRFQIRPVDFTEYQTTFMNVPAFEGVVMTDGEYTLETSEWEKE